MKTQMVIHSWLVDYDHDYVSNDRLCRMSSFH